LVKSGPIQLRIFKIVLVRGRVRPRREKIMANCTTKVRLDDGEILSCVREAHPEDENHRDWMIDFRKVDDETWEVRHWDLIVEEV
jgi:hypothetical protein